MGFKYVIVLFNTRDFSIKQYLLFVMKRKLAKKLFRDIKCSPLISNFYVMLSKYLAVEYIIFVL